MRAAPVAVSTPSPASEGLFIRDIALSRHRLHALAEIDPGLVSRSTAPCRPATVVGD